MKLCGFVCLSAVVVGSLLVAGCEGQFVDGEWVSDQGLRRQIFKECLQMLPKGPERTVYNDWAEVVSECESAAFYQSRVWVKFDN